MTTDARLAELTQQVVDHLAGRKVTLKWEDPPSQSAAGQTVKAFSGDLTIYVTPNMESSEARLRTLAHECAHSRADYNTIPVTGDRASGSVWRSPEHQKVWQADPREQRAKAQADEWMDFALGKMHDYWQVGRSKIECQLLALLDWKEKSK